MFETSQSAQRESTAREGRFPVALIAAIWQPSFGLFRANQSNEMNCQQEETDDQADSVEA